MLQRSKLLNTCLASAQAKLDIDLRQQGVLRAAVPSTRQSTDLYARQAVFRFANSKILGDHSPLAKRLRNGDSIGRRWTAAAVSLQMGPSPGCLGRGGPNNAHLDDAGDCSRGTKFGLGHVFCLRRFSSRFSPRWSATP